MRVWLCLMKRLLLEETIPNNFGISVSFIQGFLPLYLQAVFIAWRVYEIDHKQYRRVFYYALIPSFYFLLGQQFISIPFVAFRVFAHRATTRVAYLYFISGLFCDLY